MGDSEPCKRVDLRVESDKTLNTTGLYTQVGAKQGKICYNQAKMAETQDLSQE